MASPTKKQIKAALEVRFDSDAGEDLSVREYLHTLLSNLWSDQEGFNGKRPFGNSGWAYDLYAPLIAAKFIDGTLDEDGCVGRVDAKQAWAFVQALIDYLFGVRR